MAFGCRRSSSKSSIALSLTEAALDSLLTDQRSRVRAQRHCVAVIMVLRSSGIVALGTTRLAFAMLTERSRRRKVLLMVGGASGAGGAGDLTLVSAFAAGGEWGAGSRRPAASSRCARASRAAGRNRVAPNAMSSSPQALPVRPHQHVAMRLKSRVPFPARPRQLLSANHVWDSAASRQPIKAFSKL
jgi:hypothetical protein